MDAVFEGRAIRPGRFLFRSRYLVQIALPDFHFGYCFADPSRGELDAGGEWLGNRPSLNPLSNLTPFRKPRQFLSLSGPRPVETIHLGRGDLSTLRRWLIMACLCLSGGMIFLLPYLREVYYIPLQKALGLTNTQLGVLMSVFGATAMISYFPGGWLADRFPPRKLIALSLAATGAAGLYFATFPSYGLSIATHAFWGVSVTLTFWAAMIKSTRNWAPETQQGRAFGILESGRGVTEVLFSSALLALFARWGSGTLALSQVVILLSIFNLALAFMAWFTLEDSVGGPSPEAQSTSRIGFRHVLQALRMPAVWLIALIILAAYSAYWGSYYFTPYATDVFGMSVVFGGALGVGKMWIKPFAALGAGFLADRIKPSRAVAWSFAILILSFGLFALAPGKPKFLIIMVVNVAIASCAIFALRGIYYALLEEGGVPRSMTGTVTGIVSVAGYTPDIFIPMLGGFLLDRYPQGMGYRYFFLFIALLSLAGMLSALSFLKGSSKDR